MSGIATFRTRLHYAHNDWRRRGRILFPSPAEVRFVRIMGGRAVTFHFIRHPKTKFPLVVFVTMGRTLRREFVQREVRVGAMYVDFAFVNDYTKKAIEVDGSTHNDIVKEQNRDDYLRARGWRVLHIRGIEIYRQPKKVRDRAIAFLAK
jgi:very-short-patch-repair endonuclease